MPEYVSGRIDFVKTLIEDGLFSGKITLKLKHDGRGNGDSLIYTRVYSVLVNGKDAGAKLTFKYNNRDDEDTAEIQMPYFDFLQLKMIMRKAGINNERLQVANIKYNSQVRARNEEAGSLRNSPESSRIPDSI